MEPTARLLLAYRVTYNADTRRYYIERQYAYRTSIEHVVAKGLTYSEATALASVLNNANQNTGE